MPKSKPKPAAWSPKSWPDWKNEPLKFTFSPDEALRRAAYNKLPKAHKPRPVGRGKQGSLYENLRFSSQDARRYEARNMVSYFRGLPV
jgi:hypothetical protein